jgi:hypothetical protein
MSSVRREATTETLEPAISEGVGSGGRAQYRRTIGMAPDRGRKAAYLSVWQFNPNKAKGSRRIYQALPQMTAIGRDQHLNIRQNSVPLFHCSQIGVQF